MKLYTRDFISILIVVIVIVVFHVLDIFPYITRIFAPIQGRIYDTIEDAGDVFNEAEKKGYSPEGGFLMLSDFETPEELQKWRYEDVILYQSNQFVHSGDQSGKVEFLANRGAAPKIFLQYFPKRWSNFEALNFEIYNPSQSKLRVILQIKDRSEKRFKYDLYLEPQQWNKFSIPIDEMSDKINIKKIVDLNFFRWKPSQDAVIYIDDVKLVTSQYEDKKIFAKPTQTQQKVKDISSQQDYEITKTTYSQGNTITFRVNNPNKIGIENTPCTGVVEFPAGKVFEKTIMLLKDPGGQDIPYQIKVTHSWPDGSFKEAQLDFQASFQANEEKQFSLLYGSELAKMNFKSGITVRYKENVIQVSTGKLRFDLNKNHFTLLDKAWLDANGDGYYSDNELVSDGEDIIMTHNGIFYQSSYDFSTYNVEMVEAGPLRTTFRAEGYLRSSSGYDLCKFIALITAFAEQGFVEISLDFIFSKTAPIESAAIYIPYSEEISQVYSPNTGVQMDLPVVIYQSDIEKSEVRSQGRKLLFDQNLSRWVDASNLTGGVMLAVKPFWDLTQFGYYIQEKDVTLMLWPPYAQEIDIKYTLRNKMRPNYANLRNQDFNRTHDILIYFHGSDIEQIKTTEVAQAFLHPVEFISK